MAINTPKMTLAEAVMPTDSTDIEIHMGYTAQQRLDGYEEALRHATKRKEAFDKRVLRRKPGEVVFESGQLVQIYRSDLDNTFKAERKLLPEWSQPHRITGQLRNSYTLETIDGNPVEGIFHARRLRAFIPREGTRLAEAQKVVEMRMNKLKKTRVKEEETAIENERQTEGRQNTVTDMATTEPQGEVGLQGRQQGNISSDEDAAVFFRGVHVVGRGWG